jgi:hypothetical protein
VSQRQNGRRDVGGTVARTGCLRTGGSLERVARIETRSLGCPSWLRRRRGRLVRIGRGGGRTTVVSEVADVRRGKTSGFVGSS